MRDLTTGSPLRKILLFTLPLLLGNLFQQFYNLADSLIVGRYLGINAFAAVGSTGSLSFMIIGFALGVCSGCAIPIAQCFGAGSPQEIRKYIGQIIHVGVAVTLGIMLLTFFGTKPVLVLLETPEELFDDAYRYIFTIFMGVAATMLYNMSGSVLRALGDSRTPLLFLIFAALLNVFLDILFIARFGMGVEGAAYATVIAQLLSGLACLEYIRRRVQILHLSASDLRPDFPRIRRLFKISLPMGLQMSITAIGTIILQGAVNSLGAATVAAVTAASKIGNIISSPFDSLGIATATYSGQNLGAGEMRRIHKGIRWVFFIGIAYSLCAFGIVFFFGSKIACVFMDPGETEILRLVQTYLNIIGASYPMLTVIMVLRNALQGLGFSNSAMLSGLAELVARSLTAFTLVGVLGFYAVCLAHSFAWVAADLILIPLYFIQIRKLDKTVQPA